MAAIRVHLADDRTLFREGLEAILSSRSDVEVVGKSSTGEEATAQVGESKPDLIITQLDMHLKKVEEILSGLRSASPASKIVVLTMFDNPHYLKALLKLGIDAYLHKTSSAEKLLTTIDSVSHQASPGGQNVVISMPRDLLEWSDKKPAADLSEREREIVVLAARGLSNEQIAGELHLATTTVRRHLANVYQKMGVRSRTEAVRTALIEQWIVLPEITEAAN
jgi:DNA-binding NarL/FixJ family response regulator